MAIKVKNPKLKSKVFRSMKKYEDLAFKEYNKGNIKRGNKFEKKSDELYSKNYNKMFEIKREKLKKK